MAERKSFLLRISPELYEELAKWAADELRSVNAQIELLLREQIRRAGRLPERQDPPPPPAQSRPARSAHAGPPADDRD